jgi:hypothetical protein
MAKKPRAKRTRSARYLQGGGRVSDAEPTAMISGNQSGSAPVASAAPQGGAANPDSASRWITSVKSAREFLAVIIGVVALVISIRSCATARQSLKLSQQQAEANQRYHQEHVKPDVRTVVRHSSSPAHKDNAMAAELVVWNNGPIKAVSLNGTYRVYLVDPTNSHVFASMGVSEPLVDYSFSVAELKPAGDCVKQVLSGSSGALYVVNLTYYRETDMERYSTEDYFLFENGVFYDRESFRGRTNYNALMNSLLWKMRCEAQAGSNRYRVVDPSCRC